MGTCIGILRTDIPGEEYLVTSIPEKKALANDEADVVGLTKSKEQREKASA
jgi:putative N-acetylmannosamine-6-phosphate epimerase